MRTRSLFLWSLLAGCTGGVLPPTMDASVDAGPPDAGMDAGVDAGPSCGPEVCDGVDNDCNGTVDLLADGGTIFGLCALQSGTCQGARIACTSGGFPPCTAAQYGVKYEEFESLCDGVDNDCSGVVDVSQWKPIGAPGQTTIAVSVPGAWYVGKGLEAQMFDEALQPLTEPFTVGKNGYTNGGAVWFGNHLYALFQKSIGSGPSYLRRLNLDGTFLGGADEVTLPYPHVPGGPRVSNDKLTLFIGLSLPGDQSAVTLNPNNTVRFDRAFADAGTWAHVATAVGANDFIAGIPHPNVLQILPLTADLVPGPSAAVPLLGAAANCAVSANTRAVDAGSFVVVCQDPGDTVYGTDDPASPLVPFWSADGGQVHGLIALPSYAKATIFWQHEQSVWMGQFNGLPAVEVAQLTPPPAKLEIAESVRGGYLLQAVFDGGMGLRPYAAYACPP